MIEVEHLGKQYGSTLALQDVSFSVGQGEILGLLGPNGAGKTTTMRILSGYLPATTGTATIAGYEVHENPMAVRRQIGYLPEIPPLYPEMTVEGYLLFVGRIKGIPAGDRPQRVTAALERCGLLDKRRVLIRKLSKGYRQRVGIAQAIVHEPAAIILDEPTVGLDPRQIIEVRKLITSLAGDRTIILSSHILSEVSMTCNRVAIISQGQVVATDTPEKLQTQLSVGFEYDLEIRGDEAIAQTVLQSLSDLQSVQRLASSEDRLKFRVRSEASEDPGAAIASTLIQTGIELYGLQKRQVSLEEVFLDLTQKAPEEIAQELSVAEDLDSPVSDSPVSVGEWSAAVAHDPATAVDEAIAQPDAQPEADTSDLDLAENAGVPDDAEGEEPMDLRGEALCDDQAQPALPDPEIASTVEPEEFQP
jgi:ABC-2 type transport system ATP-binding protein